MDGHRPDAFRAVTEGSGRAAVELRLRDGRAKSIFQSKDDPEIGFRFQYKVILKSEGATAQRPVSFLGFWF
jgi:hypothetical protein